MVNTVNRVITVTLLSSYSGETCDDGNHQSYDGCSSSCQIESGYQCLGMWMTVLYGVWASGVFVS